MLLTLAATVTAGLQQFGFERHQLQSQDLQHLDPADRILFGFEDPIRAVNRTSRCKVFPGDSAWPRPRIWDLLDQVTGGAVIKSVPRASSCYHGPTYDPTDCKSVTSQWTNSYFQYVFLPTRFGCALD